MDLLSRIASFLAPKATAAASGAWNTGGMLKDYIEYNLARDQKEKQKQLLEYNQKRNLANEALKQFGFDANKQGNQFDPVQYGRGTLAGAGELASLYSPMGGGLKARMVINAVPGVTDAIGRGENLPNILLSGALTSLGGTGGEKLIKGGGAITRAFGNRLVDSAENLGLRKLGLTKLDVNKFLQEQKEPISQLLKRYNLIGKGAEDISGAIRPIQESFNQIAEDANLKINPNDLLDTFAKKIDEFKSSNAPELKRKGQQLEQYVTNLFDNPAQDFSAKGLTDERRIIDQLVRDFQTSGDAIGASTNRVIRDVLQDAIRETAEKAGIKGAGDKTLTELGGELKKLYSLEDVAMKRAPQPTGNRLPRLLAGSGGAVPGAMVGGIPGAFIGGVGGIAIEEAVNNPRILQNIISASQIGGKNIDQLGNKIGSEGMQKLFQMLGIGGGREISNNVTDVNPNFSNQTVNFPPNNNQNDQQRDNNKFKIGDIQNSQITPNTASIPQQPQSQEQFDPGLEVTLLDGTKTTFGQLQQQGTFQQQQQPGMGGLSEDQLSQLSLLALITGDTKALQQIAAYQGIQEKMNKQDKLPATTENRVQLANSGLRALDEIEKILQEDPNKVLKSAIPGKLGARDYDSAAFRAVEGLLRARSGAAIPETEVRRYMNANLPRIGDSPEEVRFKLDAFRRDLEEVSKSGGGTDDMQILQQFLGL